MFFVVKEDRGISLGHIYKGEEIHSAFLKHGEKLHQNLFKMQNSLPGIKTRFDKEIPTKETIRFDVIDGFLSLVSIVPVLEDEYNQETDQTEKKQVGFVIVSHKIGKDFVTRLSRLSGMEINVFTPKGLSVGKLEDYKALDFGIFNEANDKWSLTTDEVIVNDLGLGENDYYQGILPIYSDSRPIASIASLHSKAIAKANTWQMIKLLILVSIACVLLLIPVSFAFAGSLAKPILSVVQGLRDVAEGEGDLTSRLEVKSRDEMGELARCFNTFMDKLQAMIRNIAGNAETLSKSSSELSELSQQMSDGAEQMSSRANTVASSGEEMSANMDSVAAAMEQASTNVSMVATSAEEMTSTINEIAQNSEKARTITGEAVSRAQGASSKVDELGIAAQDIGKVTETINEISEQTNLLALNATHRGRQGRRSG